LKKLCKKLKVNKVNYEITDFIEHDKALKYLSIFDPLVLPVIKFLQQNLIY